MMSGIGLGGVAEGIKSAKDMQQADELLALKRDTLTSDNSLRTRGLDLQEKQMGQTLGLQQRALALQETAQKNAMTRDTYARADKQIDDTMGLISETVSESLKGGTDPIVIRKQVTPLLEQAQKIAQLAGRNPESLSARVDALLVRPNGVQAAAAEGRATAAKTVATNQGLAEAGIDTTPQWKTLDEKVKAENALRDDYLKASKDFVTMRDAKNRLDNLEKTGAGDMTLVFQFMKILDPGSTVREGEYATASNAGGVPSAVQGLYNKAIGEGTIGDKARKEILSQANRMYGAAATQHGGLTSQFRDIAKKSKLDDSNVIIDLRPSSKPDPLGIR